MCGTDASVYCPPGSGAPLPVTAGYYTNTDFGYNHSLGIDAWGVPLEGEAHRGLRHSKQRLCEEGYYCLKNGLRYECPPGRYGSKQGEIRPSCAGPCLGGHYCPSKSTMANQTACGHSDVFCPEGSGHPLPVREYVGVMLYV